MEGGLYMLTGSKLTPELSVSNIEKSLNFYINLLTFKVKYERKEDKFAMLTLGGCEIMIEQVNGYWNTGELAYPFGRGINFQIMVDDAEFIYSRLKKYDYPIKYKLIESWYRVDDKLYGQQEFLVMDPDGYLLRLAEDIGKKAV